MVDIKKPWIIVVLIILGIFVFSYINMMGFMNVIGVSEVKILHNYNKLPKGVVYGVNFNNVCRTEHGSRATKCEDVPGGTNYYLSSFDNLKQEKLLFRTNNVFHISPDGRKILWREGKTSGFLNGGSLWVANVDGSNKRRLHSWLYIHLKLPDIYIFEKLERIPIKSSYGSTFISPDWNYIKILKAQKSYDWNDIYRIPENSKYVFYDVKKNKWIKEIPVNFDEFAYYTKEQDIQNICGKFKRKRILSRSKDGSLIVFIGDKFVGVDPYGSEMYRKVMPFHVCKNGIIEDIWIEKDDSWCSDSICLKNLNFYPPLTYFYKEILLSENNKKIYFAGESEIGVGGIYEIELETKQTNLLFETDTNFKLFDTVFVDGVEYIVIFRFDKYFDNNMHEVRIDILNTKTREIKRVSESTLSGWTNIITE
tara:strand:+ start:167 stop:1435 length:1269 start_codon:yes stop_codon:yes gene_type:complete